MKTVYSKKIWKKATPEWMVVVQYRTVGDREGVLSATGVAKYICHGNEFKRPVWWDCEGRCWSRVLDQMRMARFDITEELRKIAFE